MTCPHYIEHVRAATGDIADDLLTYLQAKEVPILVCAPCAKARKIEEGDLIEGARLAPASEMIHLACDSTVSVYDDLSCRLS